MLPIDTGLSDEFTRQEMKHSTVLLGPALGRPSYVAEETLNR